MIRTKQLLRYLSVYNREKHLEKNTRLFLPMTYIYEMEPNRNSKTTDNFYHFVTRREPSLYQSENSRVPSTWTTWHSHQSMSSVDRIIRSWVVSCAWTIRSIPQPFSFRTVINIEPAVSGSVSRGLIAVSSLSRTHMQRAGASAERVPIVCTVHVRIQPAACTTITIRALRTQHTSNRLLQRGARGAVRPCTRSCIYLWKIPGVTGPDAAIRRNRASLQRQRVSREGESRIYIRNFCSLTANMPRLPARFCLSPRAPPVSRCDPATVALEKPCMYN